MKILIFEDEKAYSDQFKQLLGEVGYHVEIVDDIVGGLTGPQFMSLLSRAGEFDAIVWDRCMEKSGVEYYTDDFIAAFAKVYNRPMIANSRAPEGQELQMLKGCTHRIGRKMSARLRSLLKEVLEGEIA